MDKKFNPHTVEAGKYAFWCEHHYFEPTGDGEPFSIILPPPNVTGHLHLGHAWDVALQDTIIRYKKLQGYRTMWVPGMDHAGIATQTKFEKHLRDTNQPDRFILGREAFLNHLQDWKDEQAAFIRKQWAKMGLALSYEHEIFTMDPLVSEAVNTVFTTLYQEGLIYRAKTLVNWDPTLQTAISNIEVIHRETAGKMYYFRYHNADGGEDVIVATTRPETMFGDVALFAHPEDPRFAGRGAQRFINPVNGEVLPLLFDPYVDPNFGTGIMKCTPAHDFNDYALGKKYNLAVVNIMHPDATMNERCGPYAGMTAEECRIKLVQALAQDGMVDHIEEIQNSVGFSERTGAIVQPYLSDQWFVRMQPLARAVVAMQTSDQGATFHPERFNDTLLRWLNSLEDWCISRQLWWGHRIPVWYSPDGKDSYCGTNPPAGYHQDPDVLDTWFSSALWPMVCYGWPNRGQLWEEFFPANVLVTGYDIIFFWVSRMLMQTKHFTGERAFRDVLIHGLIRDAEGRKMSKSLGNGIDPMDVIDTYGCDALRLFLTSTVSYGEDLSFSDEKLRANWNFLNKLWNGARFIFEQGGDDQPIDFGQLDALDRWILHAFDTVVTGVTAAMNDYQFVVATRSLTHFTWDLLNNQYLEFVKFAQRAGRGGVNKIRILRHLLRGVVIMLHPQCPFITEEIYQMFTDRHPSIMLETWPTPLGMAASPTGDALVELWETVRKIRLEQKLPPHAELTIELAALKDIEMPVITTYAPLLRVKFGAVPTGMSVITTFFALKIAVDRGQEVERLTAQIEHLEAEVARSRGILANAAFRAKAPVEKVAAEMEKLANYEQQLAAARKKLDHD